MNIDKVHHIAIICSDYNKSKNFYVNILGFKIIKETYRGERDSYKLDLLVGENDQIELFSFQDPPKRSSYPEAAGLRHIAFQVKDIIQTVKELQAQQIITEPIRMDELTGRQFTFFSDPDGLPIELYEE